MNKFTRRTFLVGGALVGGGALFGFIATPNRLSLKLADGDENTWLATWLGIGKDNSTTIFVPHAEMGQGVLTSLPMMLAEELDADWSGVKVEQAPPAHEFAVGDMIKGFLADDLEVPMVFQRHLDYSFYKIAGLMNMQITGGSGSVRFTGQAGMRRAGAAVRELLVKSAALEWNVPESECSTGNSHVHHEISGKSIPYAELASGASSLTPSTRPELKSKSEYTICGQPIPRLDIPSKVTGTQDYGIDTRLPGMKFAAIRHAPVFGGTAVSFDDSKIQDDAHVDRVVKLDNAVVVIADNYWRASKALGKLPIEFSDGENGGFSSKGLADLFSRELDSGEAEVDLEEGDVESARNNSERTLEAEYRVPFLAHATMEPMNCTAWYRDGQLELWTGTQDLLGARAFAAEVAGIDIEQVQAHAVHLGGGFGRRLPSTGNYIEDAVKVAMQVDYPVQLIWSREEDMRQDYYRPAVQSRISASLSANDELLGWENLYTDIGINDDIEAAFFPYQVPNRRISRVRVETPVPVSYWRSVEHSYQGFFIESFVDEIAHSTGTDPLSFRLQLLQHSPRYRQVLEKVAENIGWGRHLEEGRGIGVALKKSFGTIVAQAAEVSIGNNGKLKVHRISAVVDPGEVINPAIAKAQIESAIVYGLTATMFGEISIENGHVTQGNFPDYPMLKLGQTPAIDVEFVESGERIGGMGEVGLPPVAAAVCNALFACGGPRVRQLPLSREKLELRT